jgi:sporulation protein YlmC with PRC-barrel domain
MSWNVTDLRGDEVLARDGSIGTLDDVYFDDERWAVRYMVVDTGGWIAGRRMLVSPQAVEAGLSDPGKLRIGATREQLREAPGAQEDAPALRSSSEVIGYEVHALDGDLGRVDDFVIDEHDWKVSGVVVDTKSWWPGGRVRVAPEHIDRIDWAERKVHVRLSRDELKASAG